MEHGSAAAAVLQLLSNRSLPEVGQLPVLLGAVPMLERQELPPLFGVEDTQQLLTHLQVNIFGGVSEEQHHLRSQPLFDMLRAWLDWNYVWAIHLVRSPDASNSAQYQACTAYIPWRTPLRKALPQNLF